MAAWPGNAVARFVRFEARLDPKRMPGQQPGAYGTRPEDDPGGMGATVVGPYHWPYVEGLRLDEALHDLTMLATGIYGRPLHPANGAPLRLVVPWKYGFKSIKNITRIDLVEEMPVSFWMAAEPLEHGFYACTAVGGCCGDDAHVQTGRAIMSKEAELGQCGTIAPAGAARNEAYGPFKVSSTWCTQCAPASWAARASRRSAVQNWALSCSARAT